MKRRKKGKKVENRYLSACMAPQRTKQDIEAEIKMQKENYRKRKLVTVGKLITALEKYDPDLPVCLTDWNEQYNQDNNESAGLVKKVTGRFYATEDDCYGEYIAIGG